MDTERKPRGYWTKENCQEEALKYQSRGAFLKGCPSGYQSSLKNGWLNEVCRHMPDWNARYDLMFKRFLSHKVGFVPDNFWISEKRAVQRLFALKDETFWSQCQPNPKLNSLNWFLTEWGRRYINEQQQKIKDNDAKRLIVENNKKEKEGDLPAKEIPVEDYNIVKKPKSLLDFLG